MGSFNCRQWVIVIVVVQVTKRGFYQLGIPYDENLPRNQWTIPAKLVANLSDLEYCLLAYLVSDLQPPPLGGITQDFEEWVEKIMGGACRLKAAVSQGIDAQGKHLFD